VANEIYTLSCSVVQVDYYEQTLVTNSSMTELFSEYVQGLDSKILKLIVMPDHTHLFALFPPMLTLPNDSSTLKYAIFRWCNRNAQDHDGQQPPYLQHLRRGYR